MLMSAVALMTSSAWTYPTSILVNCVGMTEPLTCPVFAVPRHFRQAVLERNGTISIVKNETG